MFKKLLFKYLAAFALISVLYPSDVSNAQSNNNEDFERAAILTGTSPTGWSSTQSAAGFLTSTSSPLLGSRSLVFNRPTSGSVTPVMSTNLAGANFNVGGDNWEWVFLYRTPASGVSPAPSNNISSSTNGWRLFLNANGTDPSASGFIGYYLTQSGSNLQFYQYAYGNLVSETGGSYATSANTTYVIRVVREVNSGGQYKCYISPYTGTLYSGNSIGAAIFDQLGGNYKYNFFQASVTSGNDGIFKWDNLSMYKATLTVSGLNVPGTGTGGNGIAAYLTQNDVTKAVFGFKATAVGSINITQFKFTWNITGGASANNNYYFSNAKLYASSADDVYTPGADDTSIGTITLNSSHAVISLTENIVNQSKNYFVVVDVDNYTSSTTATANIGLDTYTYTGNGPVVVTSTIPGTNFTLPTTPTTWTGTTNTSWTTATNWNGGVPSTTGSAIIPSGMPRYPILAANQTVSTLSLTGGSVNLSTYSLIVNSSVQSNGGSITGTGFLSLTGGSGDRSISGTGLSVTNLKADLPLTTETLNIYGPVSVSNLLTVSKGILSSGGNLTLVSTSTNTASLTSVPSGASVTGNVNVQRYFAGGNPSNRGWRLMSSPVNNSGTVPVNSSLIYNFTSLKTNLIITGTGGSASGWDQPSGYTANGPTILFYNNTGTGSFIVPTTFASTNRNVGQGFYFYFRGNNTSPLGKLVRSGGNFTTPESNVVGIQSGTLNQGNFSYPLSAAGTGYNLLGNPYPSSITVTNAALSAGPATGFFYLYTPGGSSMGPGVTSVSLSSGQGFFFKANTGGNLNFTESMKTATQPIPLLMSTSPVIQKEGFITMQMVQDSANYDVTLLRFSNDYNENYLNTEDADDLSANGQTVFLGAMTADKHLVSTASQPLNKKKTAVYLSVDDASSGTFTLNKMSLTDIPEKYDVWLKDNYKKDSLDLRANSSYSFNIDKNNAATFGDNRFEVAISLKTLPPYKLITFNGQKNTTGNVLKWNTQNEYNYTYFELQRSFDNKNFESIDYAISTSAGNYSFTDPSTDRVVFYRLKQTDIYDVVTYSSIVIVEQQKGDAVFSVFPNPVNNILKFDIKDDVKGSITMTIYNSVGRMVKSSSHSSKTGQENVSSLLPGAYTVELIDNGSNKRLASTKFIKQ